jgi:hypothetical protein
MGEGITRSMGISGDFAGDQSHFIEAVDRAQAMVAIGNDDCAQLRRTHQKQRRQGRAFDYFLTIFLDVQIAHAQQRQSRGSKDVFGFELADFGFA